jgi:hypothetical protein
MATAIRLTWGHTLSPFAAGIVFLVLLVASYSRRGAWIALGSVALSLALVSGCLFLATAPDRSQVRTRLEWVATKFPRLLDRQMAEELAASLARVQAPSPCGAGQPGCGAEMAGASPAAENKPVQAAATTPGWFDTKPATKAKSQSPVDWALVESGPQSPVTSPLGFSISGTNVSGEALEQVQVVLKPDSALHEVPLALSVEGDGIGNGSVIPPDAHFSLFAPGPEGPASGQTGGAILTFRYVQAGQRKSSILYLTPAMLARFANRE